MPTRQKKELIRGPDFYGRPTFAEVKLKYNKVSANVSWSIGGVDLKDSWSMLFHRLAEASKFSRGAIDIYGKHVKINRKGFGRSSFISGSERWGYGGRLPQECAEEIFDYLVAKMRDLVSKVTISSADVDRFYLSREETADHHHRHS